MTRGDWVVVWWPSHVTLDCTVDTQAASVGVSQSPWRADCNVVTLLASESPLSSPHILSITSSVQRDRSGHCSPASSLTYIYFSKYFCVLLASDEVEVLMRSVRITCIWPPQSVRCSHLVRVQHSHYSEIMVLLLQLPYAIKNQLNAPKAP